MPVIDFVKTANAVQKYFLDMSSTGSNSFLTPITTERNWNLENEELNLQLKIWKFCGSAVIVALCGYIIGQKLSARGDIQRMRAFLNSKYKETDEYNKLVIRNLRESQEDVIYKMKCCKILDQFYSGLLDRKNLTLKIKSLSIEYKGLNKYKGADDLISEVPLEDVVNLRSRLTNEWIKLERKIRQVRLDYYETLTQVNASRKVDETFEDFKRRRDSETAEHRALFFNKDVMKEKFDNDIGLDFIDIPFENIISRGIDNNLRLDELTPCLFLQDRNRQMVG